MAFAGELIAIFGIIAMVFPYMLHLDHAVTLKKSSGVPSYLWRLWSIGALWVAVYFAFHPESKHHRHHHQITDYVMYPTALRYGMPIFTVSAYLCRLSDKYLDHVPANASLSSRLGYIVRWLIVPTCVTGFCYGVFWILHKTIHLQSRFMYVSGFFGSLGALLFFAACMAATTWSAQELEGSSVILHHIPLMIQMLGMLSIMLDLVLNYVNVDWIAVVQFCIMFTGLLVFVLSRIVANRQDYKELEEIVDGFTDEDEFEV